MNQQKMTKRTKAALWLLIAPTALWIVVFIAYAIVNFALASATNIGVNSGEDLFSSNQPALVSVIANVILFLAGTIAFISWLPGLIIGIVLLATKPHPTAAQPLQPTQPVQPTTEAAAQQPPQTPPSA